MAKKEELKEPDPFLKATIGLWDKIHAARKPIAIVLGLAFVVAAIASGVEAHNENQRMEAGAALSKALHVAQRPVASEDDEKPETPPAPEDAPFKTDAERQTALISALKEVRAKYASTEAGNSALLAMADAQLKLGQLDDAATSYAAYLSAAPAGEPFRALAELGQARVAEAKKDMAAAAAAYENLQRDAPHAFLKDAAALGKARMLEQQGKKQEAAAAYQDVKEGFQGTDASREATERLAMLATQGITPPARAAPVSTDAGAPKAE